MYGVCVLLIYSISIIILHASLEGLTLVDIR